MNVEDDHYLSLTLTKGRLVSKIECLNHPQCEATRRVEEEDSSAQYQETSLFLEWYMEEEPTALRSGAIHLEATDENDFVWWRYLENSPEDHPDYVAEIPDSEVEHALIGYVQKSVGPVFYVACLTEHSDPEPENPRVRAYCPGDWLNEESTYFSIYAGPDGEPFKNAGIELTINVYKDYWGETDVESSWVYR